MPCASGAVQISPSSITRTVQLGDAVNEDFTITANLPNEVLTGGTLTEAGVPENFEFSGAPVTATVRYAVTIREPEQHCTRIYAEDGLEAGGHIVGCEFGNCNPSDSASVDLTFIDPLVVETKIVNLEGAPSEILSFQTSFSGGRTPYNQPTSALGATVTISNGALNYEYEIPSGSTGILTDTVTLSGQTTTCGGDSATISVNITVLPALSVNPATLELTGAPGQLVQGAAAVAGGVAPYQASASGQLGTASVSGGTLTYQYTIPSGASGTLSDTITVTDAVNEQTTVPVTIAVTAQPIAVYPSPIELSTLSLVNASNRAEQRFSVSGGIPPYTLAVASGGRGTVEPARLEVAGSAVYTVEIPANEAADTIISDTIIVTDSSGEVSIKVPVTVAVAASNTLSSLPGLTPNQRNVAVAIETVCPQLVQMGDKRSPDQDDLLEQCSQMLENPYDSGTPQALNDVTNQGAAASTRAGIETGTQQIGNLSSRLVALRGGSTGIDFGGLAFNIDGQVVSGSQVASAVSGQLAGLSGGGASADSPFGRWGFFLTGTFNFGDKDRTENETGFDFDSTGITGGADYRFTDDLVAGMAIGFAKNNVDFDSVGGGLDTDTWHLAAYGSYYLSERMYIDAIVEYGWHDYDSRRNIQYQIASDVVRRQAEADYDGNQLGARLGTGYDITDGALSYGVYGGVAYLKVDVDGFTEGGASGLNLRLDGFDATSVTSTLGGRISRVFNTAKAVITPQLRVEWEHEYDNDATTLAARFAADPFNTVFGIETDSPDRDYFRIGLGVSAVFPHGVSAYVNYDTILDKRDWTDHLIDAGVRWEFY